MNECEVNCNWWSLGSFDKSIDKHFENLNINGSSDSTKDESDIAVARGNPAVKKSISQCDTKLKSINLKKSNTSPFVLPFLKDGELNLELSKSSGYNSSQSPTKEYQIYNMPREIQLCPPISTTYTRENIGLENNSPYVGNMYSNSKKRQLKNLIKLRLFNKKVTKDGNEQFIFEFGDTSLIKSCRTGQVSGVQSVLDQLLKENQLILIDQRNSANETALSIATYQMNESMIRLLIKYYASPTLHLTMNNNVLHLAAAMTNDIDRRTLTFLINAIKQYQPACLFNVLTNKNIFNEDVSDILKRYRDQAIDDIMEYQCLQKHIEGIQYLIKASYMI